MIRPANGMTGKAESKVRERFIEFPL